MAILKCCIDCARMAEPGENRCPECLAEWKAKRRERDTRVRGRAGVSLRAKTLKLYGGRCAALENGRRCTVTEPLEVHHVDGDPGNNAEWNRVAVCIDHHQELTRNPDSHAEFAPPDVASGRPAPPLFAISGRRMAGGGQTS